MIYNGTVYSEAIMVTDLDTLEKHHITLTKDARLSRFTVTSSYSSSWCYTFKMYEPSDYDRIRFKIMEFVSMLDSVEMLLGTLDVLFEEYFAELLVME